MSAVFLRTARALAADSFRRDAVRMALATALLAAWGSWLFLARLPVYEVSDQARLEIDRAVHPVEAPVEGRLVMSRLELGAAVVAGDVLAELDAESTRLDLAEQRARLGALAPESDSLRREVAAEEQALAGSREAGSTSRGEAEARLREAEAGERLAIDEESRLSRLHAEGQVAEVDLMRARAELARRRAAADSARLAVRRGVEEHSTAASDRQARIERLRGEILRLDGQTATVLATIERLEHEVSRRLIRAPATGTLAEVAKLGTGAEVRQGDRLGAVVPTGTLRAVAEFPPPAAVGRVRPGQPARLRLDGFTWTQYGTISARVTQVASEARDGRIRVELALTPAPDSPIPLEHGLPGSVEIEVERVSPANLVLRAAGKLVTRPAATEPPRRAGGGGGGGGGD